MGCGIVGFQTHSLKNEHVEEIFSVARESRIRGLHAFGISISSNGKIYTKKWSKFPPVEEFNKLLAEHLDSPVRLIFHSRYSTSWGWKDHRNNQPLSIGGISLALNGVISQAPCEEWKKLYDLDEFLTENDAEIFLRFILKQGLKKAFEKVKKGELGSVAAVLLAGGELWGFRNERRPLHWFYYGGAAWFVSTVDIVERALERGILVHSLPPGKLFNLKTALELPLVSEKVFDLKRKDFSVRFEPVTSYQLKSPYKVEDYREERWEGYKDYHLKMMLLGDCDPAYPALCYLADRFEFNEEQRYWIAWLYACCYCAATVYYIWSEFPDYENVDIKRLELWWKQNKGRLLFQTDRAKVKNFDLFPKMFLSYREHVGESQKGTFEGLLGRTPWETYENLYEFSSRFFYFGRYSLFLYLEAMNRLTGLPMEPTGLNLREAESCRNGLCYALGKDEWVKFHGKKGWSLKEEEWDYLQDMLQKLRVQLLAENQFLPSDFWNIETSLCAYKKLFWQKRYLGYYIDRQGVEINWMEEHVPEGVDWSVLWDFRREFFHRSLLRLDEEGKEEVGIRRERFKLFVETGRLVLPEEEDLFDSLSYKRRLYFRGAVSAY